MIPLVTARLRLRLLVEADAAFFLALVNEPDWLRHIGDRRLHTLDAAAAYIAAGPMAMQASRGYSFYAVDRLDSGATAGICGLTKREGLDEPDLGFAFLAAHRGAGLALEASKAVLAHAADDLGLRRLMAITAPDNDRSAKLLDGLGFSFQGLVTLPTGRVDRLFVWQTLPEPSTAESHCLPQPGAVSD